VHLLVGDEPEIGQQAEGVGNRPDLDDDAACDPVEDGLDLFGLPPGGGQVPRLVVL
jgi:hypothetical protein